MQLQFLIYYLVIISSLNETARIRASYPKVEICGNETVTKQEGAESRFQEHMSQMEYRVQCSTPVPKIFLMKYQDSTHTYEPNYVRLHRCDGESSCGAKRSDCRVRDTEKVKLTFRVRDLAVRKQEYELLDLYFENHTSCECRLDDQPR